MRKIWMLFLTLVCAVVWCGAGAMGEDARHVIRLAYDDETQTEALQRLADAYMQTHKELGIELLLIPKVSYYTRLESMAMGGVLPDVFIIHPERVMDFVSAGALMDLSGAGIDFSPFPKALAALYQYNGVPYAVPKDVDGIALAYNRGLFAAAEIAPPNPGWTWQDLREAALNITDPDTGVWGFAAPNLGVDGYYNLIYQNGGYVFRNAQSGFTDPKTQEAVQFWVNLALVDRVSPMAEHYPDINPEDWIATGEVAMQFVRASQIERLSSMDTLSGMLDVMLMPSQSMRTAVYGGSAFAAAANTRNAEEARAFVAYLATGDAARLFMDATSALPAHPLAREGHSLQFGKLSMHAFSDLLDQAVPMPISPMRLLWAPLETLAMNEIYARNTTVKDALDALHEQIMRIEEDEDFAVGLPAIEPE